MQALLGVRRDRSQAQRADGIGHGRAASCAVGLGAGRDWHRNAQDQGAAMTRDHEAAAPDAVVVGGGPAGLMAADALLSAGHRVLLAEAKPSVGRKFLMAGKSGLNLTRAQPFGDFLAAYGGAEPALRPMLKGFTPETVQAWAEGLGQTTFTGSTGH